MFGLTLSLLGLLLMTACTPSTRPPTSAATATPPPPPRLGAGSLLRTTVPGTPLPPFADWRVAYTGADQRLHAVSLDGKADVSGATAPIPRDAASGVWPAGTSPDGKHLAYFGSGQLTVLDSAAGSGAIVDVPVGDSAILWSPDQHYLAFNDTGYVMCVDVANGSTIIAPSPPSGNLPTANLPVSLPYGWLDATHVAVQDWLASTTNAASFQNLNVTTGQLRPIATVHADHAEHAGWFTVEPGGVYTLFSNGQYHNDPFTPAVDRINNATGAVTPLPRLTSLLPALGGFTQELWRPGSDQALVATGFPENGDLKYYLIDVLQDTATPLAVSGFPEAWSPDGGTLVVAVGSQQDMVNGLGFKDVGIVGSDPFTLTALTVDSQGNIHNSVTLTTDATTIPVLGFIRTA